MEQVNDIKVLGDGTICGGKYNKVKVMGDAKGIGAIESESVTIMGQCDFNESLQTGRMKVLGECKVEGTFESDILKVSGSTIINGEVTIKSQLKIMGDMTVAENAKVNNIKVLGEGTFKKNLSFDQMKILGQIRVQGDCEGNYLNSKGQIDVSGLLSAEKIEINPKGRSVINEIGGSDIVIKRSTVDLYPGIVVAKIIEGDNIILQNTECDVVRGNNVTILRGCIIGKIEYTGNLQKDKNSKVGEEICLKN